MRMCAAVHVGIRHADDAVIAQLARSSKSSPKPQPNAVIMALISSLASARSMRAFSTFRILPRRGRIAWKWRSRPVLGAAACGVALDQEDFALAGVALGAVRQLAGQATRDSSTVLRRVRSRALRAASRARAAARQLVQNQLRPTVRVLLQDRSPACRSPALSTMRAHLAVAQLGLGLALKLRLDQLDARRSRARPSRTSSPVRFASLALRMLVLAAVIVDDAGQRAC